MFSIFRRPLTITRHQPGQYVKGIWQEGATETFEAYYSVQPTSPDDMQSLPEGRRERRAYTLIGDTPLRSVQTTTNPDLVEIDGEMYEVSAVQEWRNSIIPHTRVIVTREI
jgi:hypothetical protein